MSATVPRHDVVLSRAARARAQAARLSSYVGATYTLDSGLYPRRRDQRCTVISYNRDEALAPLVVRWRDGATGIANPEQLTPANPD